MRYSKYRVYMILTMYAVRKEERRPQAVSSLLNISQFHLFCLFSIFLSLISKNTLTFFHKFLKIKKHTDSRFCGYTKRELQNNKEASNRGNLLAL